MNKILVGACLCLWSLQVLAARVPLGALAVGGDLWLDTASNRVWVSLPAGERLLWDGVHRLRDGQTLTVRQGTLTLDRQVIEQVEQFRLGQRPASLVCAELVERVCGADDACADGEGCRAARQLLDFADQERLRPEQFAGADGSVAQHCQTALDGNSFFPPCADAGSGSHEANR
jgi:hypothetical protein